MATVIRDFKNLPDVNAEVPGRKPVVLSFPFQDTGNPDEADEFLSFIHEMRKSSSAVPLRD